MADESKDAVAKDEKKPARSPQQQAEIDALKARLKELEEAEPVPLQEYPKWVEASDGQKVIVPDAETEKAVASGKAAIPPAPAGASPVFQPDVPSVNAESSTSKKK